MFLKNSNDGKQYIFQNPQFVVDPKKPKEGYWIVWFYRDIGADSSAELTNILNEGGVDE